MVKITNYFWDVGRYALGFNGTIGLMWLHKRGFSMFACLVFWDGCLSGNRHNPFVGPQ